MKMQKDTPHKCKKPKKTKKLKEWVLALLSSLASYTHKYFYRNKLQGTRTCDNNSSFKSPGNYVNFKFSFCYNQMCLFGERERERNLLFAGSFHQPNLDQVEAKSQELELILPCGWQGLKHLSLSWCFSGTSAES